MKRVLSWFAVLAVVSAGLVAGVTVRAGGPEQAWETIAGPLGVESGDEDGEREIVIDNPTSTISAGRFDASTRATSSGKSMRGMAATHPTKAERDKVKPEAPKVRPAGKTTSAPDSVVQTAVTGSAPTVTDGFAGMAKTPNGCGTPPDTTGDIGGVSALYYVQAVNCSVAIYNTGAGVATKGTLAGGPWTITDFMKRAMGSSSDCSATDPNSKWGYNQGDPLVSYDIAEKKWVVLDFWWKSYSGPYKFCIAVSDSDDPTGTWHGFAFDTTLTTDGTTTTWMPDYPKMGFTPNGLTITSNMFANASSYKGVGVYMLDRTTLFCVPGGATACGGLKSYRWTMGTSFFSLLPANVKIPVASGAMSTVGNFLVSDYGLSSSVRVWTIPVIDWTKTVAVTIPSSVTVSVPAFAKPSFGIPQPGTSKKLDTLGDRLMQWPQVRDSASTATVLLSRTVAVGSGGKTAGVRWEILTWDKTTRTFSAGKGTTYAPADGLMRWMPSAAINKNGEVAIGYSRSSGTMYPDIAVAGATATTVASGSLTTDIAETRVKQGTGSELSYSRWGDYASMSIDPVNGCRFWLTTEHYAGNNVNDNWQTWIQPITLTTCP